MIPQNLLTKRLHMLEKYMLPTLLLLLGGVGCKQAVEAPTDIEEMMNFGFSHFSGDAENLEALSYNLFPFVDDHLEEAETGWQVNSLSVDDLAMAEIEKDSAEDIVGAAASVPYRSTVDQVVTAISWPNKSEVLKNVKEYDILRSDDLECFLSHECTEFEMEVRQVAKASILGDATQVMVFQFRWITREEDGEVFFAMRSLCPNGVDFSTDIAKVIQQYSFALVYPEQEHARRMEAFWVDGKIIGMNVPEDYAVNQAISAMNKSAEEIDEVTESQ